MKKGVDYTGPKPWNGKALKGIWQVTYKIDGVRAFWFPETGWISRNGKPLYNLPDPIVLKWGDRHEGVEVYCSKPGRSSKENYKATIKCVRAKTKDRPIEPHELYSLYPPDERLCHGELHDPEPEDIRDALNWALTADYEGLVLRQLVPAYKVGEAKWLKVKPIETYDVNVTDIIPGTGKHKGRMGALMTPMGKVGTGFSDQEREQWWTRRLASGCGEWPMIEVECMHLTPDGKFRHPRFLRIRYDK